MSEFESSGSAVLYGRGAGRHLGAHLDERGLARALVVCGPATGANPTIQGFAESLGSRLCGVFDGVDTRKSWQSIAAAIAMVHETEPDVIIGVGAGSALVSARQISVFAVNRTPLKAFADAADRGDTLPPVEAVSAPVPVIMAPTTFSGAELSPTGALELVPAERSTTGFPIRARGRLQPTTVVFDPELFESTPRSALLGSAMNGFNKGIETIWSRGSHPISDATAMRGLRLLDGAYAQLAQGQVGQSMDDAVEGIILVQFRRRSSTIHAFGHPFSQQFGIQQGITHGILGPHVLRAVFARCDARRTVLAEALGIAVSDDPAGVADAVVAHVTGLRDRIGLPSRLRDVVPQDRYDIDRTAQHVLEDPMLAAGPTGLALTVDDILGVLEAAW